MPSAINANDTASYSFPPGIHVPSLTWFKDDASQEIDWDVQEKHFDFLISNGLHGIVIAGTNGEAATLSSDEKAQLIQTARKTAQRLGRGDIPLTVGGVAGCTRDAIRQTKEAKEAGANYYLALVPSYFHFAMNQDAIVAYFQELADASPIPLVLYNFPGVVAGLPERACHDDREFRQARRQGGAIPAERAERLGAIRQTGAFEPYSKGTFDAAARPGDDRVVDATAFRIEGRGIERRDSRHEKLHSESGRSLW